MIIDVMKLRLNAVSFIEIDEDITINNDLITGVGILETPKIHVSGEITNDTVDSYYLNLSVSGILKLPCSVTLKPVDFPFDVNIEGNYMEMIEEIEQIDKKTENTIDILPILWENILMEIPIRVTCPEATDLKKSGDGWKLVTEESEQNSDSPLSKLNELL